MQRVTQLTVFLENQPGTLAQVAKALAEANINILDFVSGTMGAAGYIQMIVDDVAKAKDVLTRIGSPYSEQPVLYAEVDNTPGSLAALAGKLAAKNINIHSGYATTMLGDEKTSIVLAVSDTQAAQSVD
jgi:hypothetical protein